MDGSHPLVNPPLVNHPCTGGSPCPPRLHSCDIDSPGRVCALLYSRIFKPAPASFNPARPSFRSNLISRSSGRTAGAPAC